MPDRISFANDVAKAREQLRRGPSAGALGASVLLGKLLRAHQSLETIAAIREELSAFFTPEIAVQWDRVMATVTVQHTPAALSNPPYQFTADQSVEQSRVQDSSASGHPTQPGTSTIATPETCQPPSNPLRSSSPHLRTGVGSHILKLHSLYTSQAKQRSDFELKMEARITTLIEELHAETAARQVYNKEFEQERDRLISLLYPY